MWHALLYVLAYHAVGILVYGHLENWGPLDTSYFLTVTATTVGYGDLTPQSDAGKAFTVVYALLGVFLVFDVLTHSSPTSSKTRRGARASSTGARRASRSARGASTPTTQR